MNYVRNAANDKWILSTEGVWYARADSGAGTLTFGSKTFDPGTTTTSGGAINAGSLIAHEFSHLLVGDKENNQFQNMPENEPTDNAGYIYAPRSSDTGEETTVDLVMSGLYGGFADNEVGEERTQQFQTIITGAFQDNYPEALLNQTSDAQPEDDNDIFLDPSG